MDGRVDRRSFPTAAFTLTTQLIAWLDAEAARRGVSKSVIVRELLETAMNEQKEAA